MENIAVYFVGSSGSGKTTLAAHCSGRYDIPCLPSAARSVASEMGVTDFGALMRDQASYEVYQDAVMMRQIEMELAGRRAGGFISDRAFDHLVFNALYGRSAKRAVDSPAFKEYMAQIVSSRNVIFLVRPTRRAFDAAVKDGDRPEYLVWEDVHRFDGCMQMVMECAGIRYTPISSDHMGDRIKLVESVLAAAGVLTGEEAEAAARARLKAEIHERRPMSIRKASSPSSRMEPDDERFKYVRGANGVFDMDAVMKMVFTWMSEEKIDAMKFGTGDITAGSPFVSLGLDNYAVNAIIDRIHGRPANPLNYCHIHLPRPGELLIKKGVIPLGRTTPEGQE